MSRPPLTQKQLEALDRGRRLPRTEKQREASRRNMHIMSKLPKTQKQIEQCRNLALSNKGRPNPHKGNVFGNSIVCHHNDLCRGKLRSDDVTYMTMSEHAKLHTNLQVKNGTHNFLFLQEKPWKRSK